MRNGETEQIPADPHPPACPCSTIARCIEEIQDKNQLAADIVLWLRWVEVLVVGVRQPDDYGCVGRLSSEQCGIRCRQSELPIVFILLPDEDPVARHRRRLA